MTTYTLSCSMGHEPMSWTTQADSKEMAAENFLGMAELDEHVKSAHPDWAGKSHDDMKAAVMGMITPA